MPTRTETRVEAVGKGEVAEVSEAAQNVEPAKAVSITVEANNAVTEADDAMDGDIADDAHATIELQPTSDQKLMERAAAEALRMMVRPDFLAKAAQAGASAGPATKL